MKVNPGTTTKAVTGTSSGMSTCTGADLTVLRSVLVLWLHTAAELDGHPVETPTARVCTNCAALLGHNRLLGLGGSGKGYHEGNASLCCGGCGLAVKILLFESICIFLSTFASEIGSKKLWSQLLHSRHPLNVASNNNSISRDTFISVEELNYGVMDRWETGRLHPLALQRSRIREAMTRLCEFEEEEDEENK